MHTRVSLRTKKSIRDGQMHIYVWMYGIPIHPHIIRIYTLAHTQDTMIDAKVGTNVCNSNKLYHSAFDWQDVGFVVLHRISDDRGSTSTSVDRR